MRTAYRVLAYLIAIEVFIQAAAVVYFVFGLSKWIDDGAILDKATIEDDSTSFAGLGGVILHGINGTMIIPLIAIVFLIVSFFAKVRGGAKLAGLVFLVVAIQIALGIFAHVIPGLGALHGINALILLGLALQAGARAGEDASTDASTLSERESV